ncbi:hypothetical protein PIB30_098954 [Stylosanthes scabra]|uniref:Uncharacterized protein n=1 Tax=Stylosanthes scabra TaxID=79078 RepID=A0ABU6XVX0_9FABA|nr:hypothetical protein [Stylosanthes scabra]
MEDLPSFPCLGGCHVWAMSMSKTWSKRDLCLPMGAWFSLLAFLSVTFGISLRLGPNVTLVLLQGPSSVETRMMTLKGSRLVHGVPSLVDKLPPLTVVIFVGTKKTRGNRGGLKPATISNFSVRAWRVKTLGRKVILISYWICCGGDKGCGLAWRYPFKRWDNMDGVVTQTLLGLA